MEAALDKGTPLDRDDAEDRSAVDAHYEAVAPVWRGLEPKARLALILPYVQSLGLLPKGLVRRLDAALRGTPADKHAAAGLIGAIARDVPGALADLRPGAVVQAAAINALSELGYSPERAVERATQIVAGNGDKPGLNDDDDCGAIVENLQKIVDRLAAPQTEVDGEVVRTPLAPGVSGAFANALRQPARPRAFNASAVPIPLPGPLGALIAALTLMMIFIEEQRRRNRPLPAEPPPDDAPEQEGERERGQSAPAAPSDATNESPDDVEAPTPEQSIRRLRRPTDPCRGLRRQVREHERKAREYEQDPYAHDNDGILATRPRELHPAIIAGRLSKLRRQIENFRRLLQRCERQHDS